MKCLIDADWLIDAAAGQPVAVRTLDRLSQDGLAVSIIAVAELYEGVFGTPDPDGTLASIRKFLEGYAVLPLSDPVIEHFARLRAGLRRQGLLIPDMDLLIAATAVTDRLTLLSRNVRHFERIPDLRLYEAGR